MGESRATVRNYAFCLRFIEHHEITVTASLSEADAPSLLE